MNPRCALVGCVLATVLGGLGCSAAPRDGRPAADLGLPTDEGPPRHDATAHEDQGPARDDLGSDAGDRDGGSPPGDLGETDGGSRDGEVDGGLADAEVRDGGTGDGGTADWPLAECVAAALPCWVTVVEAGRTWQAHRRGGGELQLEVREPGTVRLRYLPASGHHRPSWAVLPAPPGPPPETVVGGGEDRLLLCTRELAVQVTEAGEVQVTDRQGTVLLEDPAGGGYQELAAAAGARLAVTRRLDAADHLYGLGAKTGGLDRRGRRLVLRSTDAYDDAWGGYPPDADPLYQSVPFLLGLRGATAFGLFTDNTHTLEFDLGSSVPDRYTISAHGGTIDQYVIAGPTPAAVLARYAALTGRIPLPPRWTLGYHQCRWGYSPASRVEEIAQELRQRRIPADGIWLDIQHMADRRAFSWDPVAFPDPAGLMQRLADAGFKTTVIVDPGIAIVSGDPVYEEGIAGDHFLKNPDGSLYEGCVWPGPSHFPDFTAAATRDWWAGLIADEVGLGAQGIWIDMNEPTNLGCAATPSVPDAVLVDGDGQPTTMAEAHNAYALLQAEATAAGMRRGAPGRRPFVLTRAGFAGEQRTAAVWTGDAPSRWPILAGTLPMLAGLGLSGVPFAGSDVGGYSGEATPEMYARWMQLGAISPFLRNHTEEQGQDQEPWRFGSEVEAISRAVIEERYRLLPYLYGLFAEARQTGAPLLRPLFFDFPEDATTHTLDGQAMLGPWLLAAPVLVEGVRAKEEGEPNFTTYLPAGRWFDLGSGAAWDGPTRVPQRLTLAALPLFVREGAILPRGEALQRSDERPLAPLFLDVWPAAAETRTVLYEDDGLTEEYLDGAYSAVTYALQRDAHGARLRALGREGRFVPPARTLFVRVHRVDRPAGIAALLDGILLPKAGSAEQVEDEGGWWWDEADLSLVIAFPDRPTFDLEISYDPVLSSLRPAVAVPFRVAVPADTPRDRPVCVVTSADWSRHLPLAWDGDVAVGQVQVPRGEWFFYKFTRGDWETVEKWPGCQEADNRYGFGAAHPVREDHVDVWRDRCPR